MKAKPKIALIGCRNVAPTSAYSLMNGPTGVEVLLVGEFAEPLLRAVAGLVEEMPVRTDSNIRLSEPTELKDAKVCVLSSGVPPLEGDTEESFLLRNIDIVREKAELLRNSGFGGVLVVTTYPAEIMAQAAMEAADLSAASVIGIGPNVAAGFPENAARPLPLATWCSAAGCSTEFIDSCHPDCPYFEDMLERFHRYQKTTDQNQPATMASCVMRICEAVLCDEKAVLPVAARVTGEHGVTGTFINVPCVIGSRGIERVLELPLSDLEHRELLDRARENGRMFHRLTKRTMAAMNGSIG